MTDQPIYTTGAETRAASVRPAVPVTTLQRDAQHYGLSYQKGSLTLLCYNKTVTVYTYLTHYGLSWKDRMEILNLTFSTEEAAFSAYHELRAALPWMVAGFEAGEQVCKTYHASAGVFL